MDLKDFLQQKEIDFKCLAEKMPGIIRFETDENNKNGYQNIQEVFRRAATQAAKMELLSHQEETACYMKALVESAPLISKEMFDHYKNLELQYKGVLHRTVPLLDQFQPQYGMQIRESIKTACEKRMILTEKYSAYCE